MSSVNIRRAEGRDKHFMEHIMEKYLYEISAYTDMRMDSVGRYSYAHLDSYFRDSPKRNLYLIEVDGERIGFAMVNTISPYEHSKGFKPPVGYQAPDWCMAEFTVFPKMRNQGIGRDAAELIVAKHPGRWELMFDERNIPARNLWTSFSEDHDGEITENSANSRILTFTV